MEKRVENWNYVKMACCGIDSNILCKTRKLSNEELQLRQRSKQIDAELKNERKKRQHQVRLLLLGAGESGEHLISIGKEYHFDSNFELEYFTLLLIRLLSNVLILNLF